MRVFRDPKMSMWPGLLSRPGSKSAEQEKLKIVRSIYQAVEESGDLAVRETSARFDGVRIQDFKVDSSQLENAGASLSTELKAAIRDAKRNIEVFHKAQMREESPVEVVPGVTCWRKAVPIENVGLYVPGGSAPLFSTLLMLAVPAKIAGVKRRIVCTPPMDDGSIDPAILC